MGYLRIDHRAMGGRLEEYDTAACRHCHAVIKIVRRQARGAWCRYCAGPVCATPKCATRCEPFFMKIERWMRSQDFARQAGLQGG